MVDMASLKSTKSSSVVFLLVCICLTQDLIAASDWRTRPVTDLLKGEEPFEELDWNVGATGFRGWCFHRAIDSSESRQILVKQVDKGSPADGQLEPGDIILGAHGSGKAPSPFSQDARRTIADAITMAEENNPATLKLLRWRPFDPAQRGKGKTTTVTLTLETMGAYSPTAPYNCPKSSKVLKKCAKAFYDQNDPGTWNMGLLVLLAMNDPANPDNEAYQAKAREWAHELILSQDNIDLRKSDAAPRGSKMAWNDSYTLLVLGEYYYQTRDKTVFPTLEAFAIHYAKNQSWFGTTGHNYASKRPDGGNNGPMVGYGAINGTGVAGFYGMLLAKKVGVTHPDLDVAIKRTETFFSSYTGKSGIPYGEHTYGLGGGLLDMNGKNATAALAFMMQEDRNEDTKFFARLTAASSSDRQASHAGPYFNYMWPALGAAAVGEKPAAHYFNRTKWLFDLERKWDGTMVFSHYGHHNAYRNFSPAVAHLLTYALPLRQLHMTGRNHDRSRWLTPTEMQDLVASEDFDPQACDARALFRALSDWLPKVRWAAAQELGKRSQGSKNLPVLLKLLHGLAQDRDASYTARTAACLAMGEVRSPESAPMLVALLEDSNSYVRFGAAYALRLLPQPVVRPHLDAILKITASSVKPAFPLVEGDPFQFAHSELANLLFNQGFYGEARGLLSKDLEGVNSPLLLEAIRAIGRTPSGAGRNSMSVVYSLLTKQEVFEIGETIVDIIRVLAPADPMFGRFARTKGIETLQKNSIAEGLPLCWVKGPVRMNHINRALTGYGASIRDNNLEIDTMQLFYDSWMVEGSDKRTILKAINDDKDPISLVPLKKIESVVATPSKLSLPEGKTTLNVKATNYARRDPKQSTYTWRKVYGAGDVRFTPNSTWESGTTRVEFSARKPGHYRFEVTMSDTLGFTVVSETVDVTLLDQKGKLPSNRPPVADSKSITINPGVSTELQLSGSDPDGDALGYVIVTKPEHATLSGSAPHLKIVGNSGYRGDDQLVFKAIDGQGVESTGTISLSMKATPVGCTVYEGFDYKPGLLSGQDTASTVGLTGLWIHPSSLHPARVKLRPPLIAKDSVSFRSLPSTGGKIEPSRKLNPASCRLDPTALERDGILENGSEMWFSIIVEQNNMNLTNARWEFGLKDMSEESDTFFGIKLITAGFHATLNEEMGESRMKHWTSKVTFPSGLPLLFVGHCVWGKTDDEPDTMKLYRVLDIDKDKPMLLNKPISVITGTIDQSQVDSLYTSICDRLLMDEIRFGPTYESVLHGTTAISNTRTTKR